MKEGKNTLRWDRTGCYRFAGNQARLLVGVLAYDLRPIPRQFHFMGEEVKWSVEWVIKRLIKVEANVAYHGRRRYVHAASGFPLAGYYRAAFGCKVRPEGFRLTGGSRERYAQQEDKRGFFINMTTVLSLSGLVGNQLVAGR